MSHFMRKSAFEVVQPGKSQSRLLSYRTWIIGYRNIYILYHLGSDKDADRTEWMCKLSSAINRFYHELVQLRNRCHNTRVRQ